MPTFGDKPEDVNFIKLSGEAEIADLECVQVGRNLKAEQVDCSYPRVRYEPSFVSIPIQILLELICPKRCDLMYKITKSHSKIIIIELDAP